MDEKVVIKRYLGIRFQHMGRVLQAGLDCWGLVLCVYRDLGITLMDVGSYDVDWSRHGEDYFVENYYKQFERATVPQNGDILLFRNVLGVANHAGIYLSDGRFIHACKAGVVVGKLNNQFSRKLEGIYRLKR